MNEDETVTIDAASGVPRVDMIEAQVQRVTDKDDSTFKIVDPENDTISVETVKRDIKYFLSVRKQTDTTTSTSATAGLLTGTVSIPGTIDLSEKYLLGILDGEDGSFVEIDVRGATPEATTRAEIISNINTALGRTAAGTGASDVLTLSGDGTGLSSVFYLKAPVSNPDADVLETIFGLSIGGSYYYTYQGQNEWFKIAEINMGATTTVLTPTEIVNVDEKGSWASEDSTIRVGTKILNYQVLDEDSFGSNSDISLATQQSIKAYVDAIVPVGTIMEWDKDYGSIPTLSGFWAECNGQVISDSESIFNGKRIRNLNGGSINLTLTWTADAGGSYATVSANDIKAINKGDSVTGSGIAAGSRVIDISGNDVTISDVAATGSISSTFTNLGKFTRGGLTSGISQDDAFQGHRFNTTRTRYYGSTESGAGGWGMGGGTSGTATFSTNDAITDGTNGEPRTAIETRPSNMTVVLIERIK